MRALSTALVLSVGGCVGPGLPAGPEMSAVAVGRLPVHLEFVPPLAAPGRLRIAHECGEQLVVATRCSSVDLTLPPGPVAFVLQADGRSHEYAATVAPGMAAIVWNLGTPQRQ